MSLLRSAITYGLFPTWFAAAIALAIWAVDALDDPALILAPIAFGTAAMLLVVERVHPEHPEWNVAKGDVRTDILHTLVSQILLPKAIEVGIATAILASAFRLSDVVGFAAWPTQWPLMIQMALALVITQFFEYWWHRLAHTVPLLWRLHATHHSPERLYWLNAGRFHPLDTAFSAMVSLGSLLLLGAEGGVLVMISTWIAVHGLFQHCNVRLRLGPLNWIFSMAELHRWHHSLVLDEANSNFGNNILLWDIVFGTVHWPKDRQASAQIGLSELPNFPRGYLDQLASPFTWNRLQNRP